MSHAFNYDDTEDDSDTKTINVNPQLQKLEHLLAAATKRPDCFSIEKLVSPELARAMLTKNYGGNRPIRKTKVKEYAAMMLKGEWLVSGESIKFNRNGVLDDGQHRLHALILANVQEKMCITFNTDPNAFDVYDTGFKRSGGDTLNHAGYPNVSALAAALRTLWLIERTEGIGRDKISNHALLNYLQRQHPDLEFCVPPGKRLSKQFSVSTAGAAACYYRIKQQSAHPHQVEEFWGALISGANLPPKSPLLELRKKLTSKDMYNFRIERACELAATIILCWNQWITGKRGKLCWDQKAFPVAI